MQIKSCVDSLPAPLCSRTLLPSLKHPQWLASVGRDCSRRCRQCLCSSSWSRADGRALCALSIPQYLTRPGRGRCTLLRTVLHPQGLSRVEGLCWQMRTPAQGTGTPAGQTGHGMPAHCVTADASGYHSSYHIQATTLYCREM